MVAPAITEEKPVTAPASRLTAERENEPATTYPWKQLAVMLPRPCPISSWLASMRWRVCTAMALAMEIASMNPISAIVMATPNSCDIVEKSRWGRSKEGNPPGMSPTTWPPIFSNPTIHDTSVVTATAMSTLGNCAE